LPDAARQPGSVNLRFVAQATVIIIGLWAVANLAWLGRDILFTAFLAILLASFISIFVDKLERLRVPRPLAAFGVLLLLFGLLAGLFVLVWPTLSDQFTAMSRELPQALARLTAWFQAKLHAITGAIGGAQPDLERRLRARLGNDLMTVVTGAVPLLNTALGAVLGIFIIVSMAAYLAISPGTYRGGIVRMLPARSEKRAEEIFGKLGHTLRMWMVGAAASMLLVGTLSAVGLWLLGVPAPLALGLIAGLLEFVPYFGPLAAAVPAIGMALVVSPTKAIYVAILYTVIQQVEANAIQPIIMKRAVKLPPALTIFSQALMGLMFGFLGLLLAVPLLAMLRVLFNEAYGERQPDKVEAARIRA
jgi:predicted PurR-regulated permease PerM